ncbi:unnamed protein product [Chrysoparadoxa australica]
MNTQVFDDITAVVKLGHHNFDETTEYELDDNCEWVKGLLNELEEGTDRTEAEYNQGAISCNLSLKRKSGKPFGDHLLVKGDLKASYTTPCVRCLKLTPLTVSMTFKSCFVPIALENTPEFEELDEIFTENEEFALYFHNKGDADIAEMVHENLFMNITHFPLHDKNCLGLCPECGQDLNEGTCKHQKSH